MHWWMRWIIFRQIIRKEKTLIDILNRLVNAIEKVTGSNKQVCGKIY